MRLSPFCAAKPGSPAQSILVGGGLGRMTNEDRIAKCIPVSPRLAQQMRKVAPSSGVDYILE